jgi:diguanylate cyclase (GGDEF)-like protein/PAS domain S-box-containing protein
MSGTPSILLVDDHADNLVALEAALEPLGLDCVRAHSGSEALREVLRHDFAAILLDVQMPQLDGLETAALIKRRTRSRDVPIIFVTGHRTEPATMTRAFTMGAVDYVVKPYEPELLRSKVRSLVALYRKDAELRESEARFRATFEHAPIGIALLDADGRWLDANRALAEMLGRPVPELLAAPPFDLRHLVAVEGANELAELIAGSRRSFSVERRLFSASVNTVLACINVSRVNDPNGDLLHLICQVEDVTERRAAEESLSARVAFLAYHDELTGLPNRAMLREHLDLALARATRHANAVAILNLDLNNFKLVNDSLGHAAGDELLRDAGARLAGAVRASDLVARVGGDEFVVLLADMEAGKGREVAELVAAGIHQSLSAPFTIGGAEFYMGTSIGIARFPSGPAAAHQPAAEGLLRNADAAMYDAKQTGAPTVVHEQRAEAPVERLGLMTRLRRAADNGDFVLHWLPIVDLDMSRVCGAEALLRWHDSARGWVMPGELVPLAEETGLLDPIGRWVLREAAGQQAAWMREGLDLDVAVNISSRQLWMPNAAAEMLEILEAAGADANRLVLEMTESATTRAAESVDHALSALRDAGIRIAIDDFAHSPLDTLQRMQVDVLKIDASLIAAAERPEGETMLAAIIALARNLGIWPVAEGIEKREHFDLVRQSGCRFGQGFFFGRPVPADEIPGTLELVRS